MSIQSVNSQAQLEELHIQHTLLNTLNLLERSIYAPETGVAVMPSPYGDPVFQHSAAM